LASHQRVGPGAAQRVDPQLARGQLRRMLDHAAVVRLDGHQRAAGLQHPAHLGQRRRQRHPEQRQLAEDQVEAGVGEGQVARVGAGGRRVAQHRRRVQQAGQAVVQRYHPAAAQLGQLLADHAKAAAQVEHGAALAGVDLLQQPGARRRQPGRLVANQPQRGKIVH